jgi:hypothetical protein
MLLPFQATHKAGCGCGLLLAGMHAGAVSRIARSLSGTALRLVISAALLSVPGKGLWPEGRWYLVFSAIGDICVNLAMEYMNPALFEERCKPPIQSGQPPKDKLFIVVFLAVSMSSIAAMGWEHALYGIRTTPMLQVRAWYA